MQKNEHKLRQVRSRSMTSRRRRWRHMYAGCRAANSSDLSDTVRFFTRFRLSVRSHLCPKNDENRWKILKTGAQSSDEERRRSRELRWSISPPKSDPQPREAQHRARACGRRNHDQSHHIMIKVDDRNLQRALAWSRSRSMERESKNNA